MASGGYQDGTLSAEIYALLAQRVGARTSRAVLSALFPGKAALSGVLARMVRRGVVTETAQGFRLTQMPAPSADWRPPTPLPESVRAHLAAITRRAHAWRERGMVVGASELLREAASRIAPHAAAQDIAALADLFEHAPSLYPVLDLPQRAVA